MLENVNRDNYNNNINRYETAVKNTIKRDRECSFDKIADPIHNEYEQQVKTKIKRGEKSQSIEFDAKKVCYKAI